MISKLSHLKDSLVVICNMIGERTGIKVRYGAPCSTAMTDGDTVYIPAIDEENQRARDLVIGYIDHEAAHLAKTDFKVDRSKLSPVGLRISNVLEDIRIESLITTDWAGVNDNINRLMPIMVETGSYGDPTSFASPANTIIMWLNTRCRASMLHQGHIVSFADQIEATLETNMPGLAAILYPIARRVWRAPSTAEAVKLTSELLEALAKYQKDNAPPPQPKQQQPQEDQDQPPEQDGQPDPSDQQDDQPGQPGDQNDGQGADDAEGKGDNDDTQQPTAPDDQGQPDGQNDAQDDQGQPDDQTDDQPQAGQQSSSDQQDAGDQKQAPNPQAAAAAEAAANARDDELTSGDLGDEVSKQIVSDRQTQEDFDAYAPLPVTRFPATGPSINGQEAGAESGKLRARLVNVVQASRWEHSYAATTGTRIDRSKLHRIGTGDARIFKKSDNKKQVDTFCKILVDNSGSMSSHVTPTKRRIDLAMEAAYAAAVALQSIHRVTRSVSSFPGADGSSAQLILAAGENAQAEMFSTTTAGCTPLAQALMAIAPEVCARKEKRKIVIVKTDGDPDNIDAAKEVIDLYTRSGIEIIGVGMGPDSQGVKFLFDRSAIINDMTELSPALVSLLTTTLASAA